MTSSPIIDLLKKAHAEAPSAMKFIAAVKNRCQVNQSTVYRWLNDEKFPSGQNVLTLVEFLKSQEPKP